MVGPPPRLGHLWLALGLDVQVDLLFTGPFHDCVSRCIVADMVLGDIVCICYPLVGRVAYAAHVAASQFTLVMIALAHENAISRALSLFLVFASTA